MITMPVKYKRNVTLNDLTNNPDFLYLFCENAELCGDETGLAKFRGEENAVGVRLKFTPGNNRLAHISEEDSFEGMAFVDEDLEPAFEHIRLGGTVIVPSNGLIPSRLSETVKEYFLEQIEQLQEISED
jgi:hypothetical protein